MLTMGDNVVELSHFEAMILERLASNIGKTVDASELMIAVWQRDDPSNRNSLHGYIHKLRRALRHDPQSPSSTSADLVTCSQSNEALYF